MLPRSTFSLGQGVLRALAPRAWSGAAVALMLSASSLAGENPSQLPFRLYQEYLIVVKGSIGASEALNFLVDTGATRTLVDRQTIKKLGLQALKEEVQLASFKNGQQAQELVVPELRFGPMGIRQARVLATDLAFLSSSGTRIDAILGLDVLSRTSFSVDYVAKRITFGPVEDSVPAVPFRSVSPLLTIDVAIGNRAARLMVDTGAPRLTLFPNRMGARLPGFLLKGASAGQGVGGRSQLRDIELSAVSLGPTEWLHVGALLVDVAESAYDDFDGVLAPSSLSVRCLYFDFPGKRLGWKK